MSIARAILSGADILLCDEITSALDVVTEAQIVSLLQGIRQKREFSMMFVSHNIALVSQLCDRMIVMHEGKVVEEGSTQDLLENPRQEYTKKLIASSRMQSL
jgi:peptide/nickel transport system ATP-binding protein